MGFFQNIGHFFAAIGLLLASSAGQTQTAHVVQPIVTVAPQIENIIASYTADGHINYQGYTINMNLRIPKDGGAIHGNISGDCSGDITGQYDGKENGRIDGQTIGTCHLFLFQIPGSATFTGSVSKIHHTVQLHVDAKADSIEKSQTVTLSLQ